MSGKYSATMLCGLPRYNADDMETKTIKVVQLVTIVTINCIRNTCKGCIQQFDINLFNEKVNRCRLFPHEKRDRNANGDYIRCASCFANEVKA